MASSQHRCVFVGNIPYDVTEEKLIEICKEVGPVVSFRLVIDRETGKPKGYGFCEYKDEETALSARRNLQGYEINGRQLRVDFAENDKGADRNREQGRGGVGGPGLAANVAQKQLGGLGIHGESVQHQPIGLHIAITAASAMAGALGGAQIAGQSNQSGLQSQSLPANDPLTLHLASMSRVQLNELMSDLKVMATQNKEQARQLLLSRPQLAKALFQAQIMLGMATPEVLQTPNLRQPPIQPANPSILEGQRGLQPTGESLPEMILRVPMMQSVMIPNFPEGQVSALPQASLVHNQFSGPPQTLGQPQHANINVVKQGSFQSVPFAHANVRPQIQTASSYLNQQMQPPLPQHAGQLGAANLVKSNRTILSNAAVQPSLLLHPPSSKATDFQPGPSLPSGISDSANKVADKTAGVANDPTWSSRSNAYPNVRMGLAEKRIFGDASEASNQPSKLIKLEDGRGASSSIGGLDVPSAIRYVPSQAIAVAPVHANPVIKAENVPYSGKQTSQLQVPTDVESALLQQVMNLTPEQLNLLPAEQRQQVIQLQQALRREQMQSL
ncbi:cleavage stimulating factor 64-like [Tripterygium wilfordii]|uniref:cleavage stimulating factor 64-like n=1 Tax=Tripterygium wilfordii TaxID=458696 RepID=UPI0018F7FC61|nr:cleavage stimulating factor 64-like [Tripterygium wilfordii]